MLPNNKLEQLFVPKKYAELYYKTGKKNIH